MAEYVRDEFTRTLASGWGTAPIGGAWTESLTDASSSVVVNAQGRVVIAATFAGQAIHKLAAAPAQRDVALARTFVIHSWNSTVFLRTYVRVSGAIAAPVAYYGQVNVAADGSMVLSIGRSDATTSTNFATSLATPAGSYVAGVHWRLELVVSGSPTTIAARIWKVSDGAPKPNDGWLRQEKDMTGPQTAGVYQLRVVRTAPAVAFTLLVDTSDVYVTDPPQALFTSAVSVLGPNVFTFNATSSTGDITSYSWGFGDGGAESGATLTNPTHTYFARGMYPVTLRINTRWGAYHRVTNNVVADYPEAGTGPGQILGPLLPSILIDGVNVCDRTFAVSWSLGRNQWADPFQGQTCSISLRGRYAASVGDRVSLSAPRDPNGAALWSGLVDQVSMTINPVEGEDETQVTAIDVASLMGRWHVERGTKLWEDDLPDRLADLDPSYLTDYRAKWAGVPASRWPTLKEKDWKIDKLREKTYLDLLNDALYGSIATAYVARNGDIVYAPWEPPSGQGFGVLVVLDSGADCAAQVLLDRNSPNGVVNRWTVGDGDAVDLAKRSSIEDYGEHAISVSQGVLNNEASFPITDARFDAMAEPADAATAEVPVTAIGQKCVVIEPLDFAEFEGQLYTVLGVRHTVSLTSGWRCTLTLDRDAWATAGQSAPAAMSKPGPEPERPEIEPLEEAA